MEGGPPVFHADSSCPHVLRIHFSLFLFRVQDYHLLRFGFPSDSARFPFLISVLTPKLFLAPVWPLPRSLATTCGISFDFSSSAYLDVSVRQVPSMYLFCSVHRSRFFTVRVSPFGNPRIEAYLQLPAAYRSLSRPSSAPSAKAFTLCSSSLELLYQSPDFQFSNCLSLANRIFC